MKRSFGVLILLFGTAHAAEPRLFGTYTDMRFLEEDVVGTEITLVYGGGRHYVIVQCTEGEPSVPVVAPAELAGRQLTFKLPCRADDTCPSGKFTGQIRNGRLEGRFEGVEWKYSLKRGRATGNER